MQCKDIPDDLVLSIVQDHGKTMLRWDLQAELSLALGVEVPERLILAKASRLIQRGLMEGCGCGCWGDFSVREKEEQ